jgi:hypothetical protein
VAAKQWRRGRGGSVSGEDRGGADQLVARLAPLWSRGGAEMVGGQRAELAGGCSAAAAGARAPASRQLG